MDPAPRSSRVPPRWFIRGAWLVHRAAYRMTRGRFGLRRPKPTNWGMLRLHTLGRRSGRPRVAILGYFEDGSNLVTLAMNGWAAPEPAWWLNLQAQPQVSVDLPDGSRRGVVGRASTGEERQRLWDRWGEVGDDVDGYARLRPTETAVVVLEPRAPALG